MKNLFICSIVIVCIVSCGTPEKVVYFQDARTFNSFRSIDAFQVYIHQDDMLAIMVNSQATEAALPFNLPMSNYYIGGDSYGQQRLLGYLVDKEGCIDFPVLGKLKVEGLTRNQLRDMIKDKLRNSGQLKDPIVSVNFLNFKVSVIGEVSRPGSFNVTGERITLLEALSMAGDLTIYGRRDRIAVIRESEGKRSILYHDITRTEIFESPCYYLQQNDIVYVEPNNRKAQQSEINQNNNASIWLSVVSVIMTATSVIINLSR
jgi:polysaccharide export outer membrane protein